MARGARRKRRSRAQRGAPSGDQNLDFTWSPEHLAFRDEVRALIREWRTPELLAEYAKSYGADGPLLRRFRNALVERGFLDKCFPMEGAAAGDALLQFLFVEEMEYWGMPYGNLTYTSIGPTLARFGSDDQKHRYLPGIRSGELCFALAYSEPNAGSDLASLRTRAVRVGDEWVIDGQKIWTSLADVATHIWLAARTDPDAPRHQGISLFIVPRNAQGVTIRPLHAMYGGHTNETFYDGVRVPHADLVGLPNQGWPIIMHALNHERVALAATGALARLFDELVAWLAAERPQKLADPLVRRRLAELELDLHEHRALAWRNAWIISQGGLPISEASMAKVSGTELRARLANTALDLLGREGALSRDEADAPAEGRLEFAYRIAPIFRFGGGTNEIMRDIIAAAGLRLPR
jgi:alkylation response protein AidB-like acyl-CoA dehydrogenase